MIVGLSKDRRRRHHDGREPQDTAAHLADKLLQDEHADLLRESVAWMAAQLMDAEVTARIGAELGERAPDRTTQRNGYRPREWTTRVGSIELAIPKLRQGSYFPSFLEPRRRAEQAWSRSSKRPTSTGCPPARSTGWWSSSADTT